MLERGRASNLQWTTNGQPTGNIVLICRDYDIELNYRVRDFGQDWKSIKDSIPVERIPQHFGGERIWYRCPSCHLRCRVIFGGEYFRCRRCYGATYASQYAPKYERVLSKAQDVRMQLGGSGSMDELFPEKPKWMRWKTYYRLKEKDDRAEEMFLAILANWNARCCYK